LGDTIRVSLTEDSVYEIPVAQAIARKTMSLWATTENADSPSAQDSIDPYHYTRRETDLLHLGDHVTVGPGQPPVVVVRAPSVAALAATRTQLAGARLQDTPAEGLLVPVTSARDLAALTFDPATFLALELDGALTSADLTTRVASLPAGTVLLRNFTANESAQLTAFARFARAQDCVLAAQILPDDFPALGETLRELGDRGFLFTLPATPAGSGHALGGYRRLAEALRQIGSRAPLWIRNTTRTAVQADPSFLSRLLEAAFLSGGLLCDGLGDMVSVETEADAVRAVKLTYNVLQGAGARTSKTEFVACPSCGRTLFDLQTTTQRIRAQTGHLKGVKLAIMGCIVNGPGEMADADFGYVGGAPGKINLYVGKQCVQYNIPQAEADDRLIALIKEHGKWVEAAPA
jgi:(E)-4-hydroxy-3-methylbut-2-enyl-diphosphate synthase